MEGPRRGTALLLNLPLLLFLLNLACTWCLRLKFLLSTSLPSNSSTYSPKWSIPYFQIPIPSNIPILSWWFEVVPLPENTHPRRRVFSCVLWASTFRLSEEWASRPPIAPCRMVLFLSKLQFAHINLLKTQKVQFCWSVLFVCCMVFYTN